MIGQVVTNTPGRAIPTPSPLRVLHTYASSASNLDKYELIVCEAFQGCKCCYDEAIVGANVGTEGKLGKEHGKGNSNGNGGGANVGHFPEEDFPK